MRAYLAGGGNAFFMLDPFVRTGLEPVLREYGVVVDDDIVIDEASHFWTDVSSPAVSDYNRHQVTRDLPLTFFPGVRSLSPTPERVPGTSVVPLVNSSKEQLGAGEPDRVELREGGATVSRPAHADGRDPRARTRSRPRRPRRAAATPGARRSRIAVVGDSDFATNSFFHIMGNGTLFLNTVNYLGRPGEPDRPPATHRRPAPGQPHQPADEGHVLPLRGPGSRAAGRGGHGGVVEAAVSRGPPRARGLVAVWLVLAVLVAVHRGDRVRRPPSGEPGDADGPAPAAAGAGGAAGRHRDGRRRDGCIASSATPRAPGSITASTPAAEAAPRPRRRSGAGRSASSGVLRRASAGRASSATFPLGKDGARLRRDDARDRSSSLYRPKRAAAAGPVRGRRRGARHGEPIRDGRGQRPAVVTIPNYQIDNLRWPLTAAGPASPPSAAAVMRSRARALVTGLALAAAARRRAGPSLTPVAATVTPCIAVDGDERPVPPHALAGDAAAGGGRGAAARPRR